MKDLINKFIRIISIIALLIVFKCISAQSLLKLLSPNETGVYFRNDIIETSNRNIMVQGQIYEYNGGGVAIGDLDNDGLEDLLFTGNCKSSQVYKNLGNLKFENKTISSGLFISGWATGVTMADVNNDGLLDIYVCKARYPDSSAAGNQLFINKGNFIFKDETIKYGLTFNKNAIQASFFDFDKDGDLDFYLLVHPIEVPPLGISFDIENKIPKSYGSDILYENLGNENGFKEVTNKLGLKGENAFGLGIITADFDNDGWDDIYVANDFVQQDFFFKNLGNGTFKECLYDHFAHTSYFSMGCDLNDMNNDLLPDLFVADMCPNTLMNYKQQLSSFNYNYYSMAILNHGHQKIWNNFQLNNSTGMFSEIANFSGVANTDWSWSPLMVDIDVDGNKDLVVSNGIKRDVLNQEFYLYTYDSILTAFNNTSNWTDSILLTYVRPYIAANLFYKNNADLTFQSNAKNWGINDVFNSNGAAYADLDLDGDMEIVFNNTDTFAAIYNNLTQQNDKKNWIELKLNEGSKIPYGTKVILYQNTHRQFQCLTNTRGYQSKSTDIIYFGLGNNSSIDSILILWPDNTSSHIISPKINQLVTINKIITTNKQEKLIVNKSDSLISLYKNSSLSNVFYKDFTVQPLLYKSISDVGIATSFLKATNKIYVGSFLNSKAHIIQVKNDSIILNEVQLKNADTNSIQYCALEIDLNKDNKMELLISSGHLFSYQDTASFKLNAYTLNQNSLINNVSFKFPKVAYPISTIIPLDIDGDNDLDLFLGAAYSKNYPNYPQSYLWENKGNGIFVDITKQSLPLNGFLGNIKKAIAFDINQDKLNDLILVGEWMPVRILKAQINKKFFVEDIPNSSGLWQTISIDSQNSETRILLGNLGINSRFQKEIDSNPSNYLSVATQDLNGDGIIDPLISFKDSLHQEPIYLYPDFIEYFPAARKKAFSYIPYSTATIKELMPKYDCDKELRVNQFNSAYLFLNNNKVEFEPFDKKIQTSSINNFYLISNNSFLCMGNQSDMRRDIGAIDASRTSIVKWNEKTKSYVSEFYLIPSQKQYLHAIIIEQFLFLIDKFGQIDAIKPELN